MTKKTLFLMLTVALVVLSVTLLGTPPTAYLQQRPGLTPEQIASRNKTEQELQSIAIVERKLMIPMRDG